METFVTINLENKKLSQTNWNEN